MSNPVNPSPVHNAITDPVPAVPGKPEEIEERSYILYYRDSINPHAVFKFFRYNGGLKQAIDRAKVHCDKLRLRFILVKPLWSTLEAEEKRMQEYDQ